MIPWDVALRTVISFFVMFFLFHIMNKKQIAELTFFNFVTGITMGAIAGKFAIDRTPIADGITSLVLMSLLTMLLSYISLNSVPARKILAGEPTVVIQNGKILEQNMAKMHYTVHDLLVQLRLKDVFNPGEVEFAILEPNGQLSVLKKSQYQPVNPSDLNLPTSYKGLASELVVDGKVVDRNLAQNGLSRQWLEEQFKAHGVDKQEDVLLASLGTDGKLYLDKKSDPGYRQHIED